MAQFNDDLGTKKITELHQEEAEELAQMLAGKYSIPYADLSKFSINTDALRSIPEAEARAANVAAFQLVGRKLELAILTPNNPHLPEIMENLKRNKYEVGQHLVSNVSLERAWERYKEVSEATVTRAGLIDIAGDRMMEFVDKLKSLKALEVTIEEIISSAKEKSHGTSLVFEAILAGAISLSASDIHIEPEEGNVRVRYRMDGVLHDAAYIGNDTYHLIISRIKLVSGMKLNVKLSAQDGRFSITLSDNTLEIRVSVLPGNYGESVVMRILDPKSLAIKLSDMGIEPHLYEVIQHEIAKPNGMILTTGPTGSGKSTTLYAFLNQVNESGTKIITIEDPIEYHLKGISQTQVNEEKGYTFLEGLRSALRQDPDIIMVGEIRDSETAKIAINSSLTGHLVFSTLHTNNAAGAIPRLIDLGVNPKVISSALTLTLAQRLLRRLCSECKIMREPTVDEKKVIDETLASIDSSCKVPIPDKSKVGDVGPNKACEKCAGIGYKGRIGVFEGILMTRAVEETVINNPSERDIKKAAAPEGILDMRQDGVIKVLQGVTSMAELGRVVDLYNLT
ncbi:MAG: ATPase, T2SS/T4P/T4SS family [Candidatus Paceibacterota bacterium]|jgi:type IV pilus assembly protein PilB